MGLHENVPAAIVFNMGAVFDGVCDAVNFDLGAQRNIAGRRYGVVGAGLGIIGCWLGTRAAAEGASAVGGYGGGHEYSFLRILRQIIIVNTSGMALQNKLAGALSYSLAIDEPCEYDEESDEVP